MKRANAVPVVNRAEQESVGSRARTAISSRTRPALRALGALALLAVGVVHLQQYLDLYSAIPTIGTLFLLNFAGAAVLSLVLLAPTERWAGSLGSVATWLAALGGVALAGVAFVFLAISERTPLFGFREPGYDPTAIAAARIAEVATVVLLGSYLLTRHARDASKRRSNPPGPQGT